MQMMKKIISFEIKNHLVTWIIAIAAFFLCAHFVYESRGLFIAPREVETIAAQQTKDEDIIGEIIGDSIIVQSFTSEKDTISRIQIPFGTYGRQNDGLIKLELREVDGPVLDKREIELSGLQDGMLTTFDFEPISDAKGKKFVLILSAQNLEAGKSVTMWKSLHNQYKDGELFIDGDAITGDLKFKVLNVEQKPLLSKGQFIAIGMALLFMFLVTILLIRFLKHKIHYVFLVTSIPIGIILSIIIPPFDQLDELEHFYRAYEVSVGKFTNQETDQGLGNYIPESLVDTVNQVRYIHQEGLKYSIVKDTFAMELNPDKEIFLRNYASSYPPIIYIPQSIGIIIGKLFDASPLMMMYLGRILNLLAYVAIVYVALKLVPIKKKLFYLLALLPMSIIHAASLSADGITNATALLFVSYILYLAYGKVEFISKRHLLAAIAIGLFIALSKIVYLPIILLFLIIPIRKFKNRKSYWLNFMIVMVGCTLPFIIWNLLNLANLSVPDLRVNPAVSPKDQVIFVLSHPIQYIRVMINTIMSQGSLQLVTMIGKAATNYNYLTPSITIYLFLFMLFIYGITTEEPESHIIIRGLDKLIFLGIFFSVVILIYTALYVGFTNVGNSIINGIQGRYFVPIAAYFFLSLSNSKVINKDENIGLLSMVLIHSSMFALLLQYILNVHS